MTIKWQIYVDNSHNSINICAKHYHLWKLSVFSVVYFVGP